MSTTQDRTREIADALAKLESENGRLTPSTVVAEARDSSSVLHGCFEWDDTVAAHRWRIDQARTLIASVRVEISVADGGTVSTVRYVRDPEAGADQGYVSIGRLQREPANAALLLDEEFGRAAACLTRAESIARALGQEHRVRKVTRQVEKLRDAVREEQAAKKKAG